MPICYHCGRETSELYHCNKCNQNYCVFHQSTLDHECDIVIAQIQSYQVPSISTQYGTTLQSPDFTPSDSPIRGTTDGTYTWYRQEKSIPDNAFDPNSGIEFKGILLAHKSELLHFLIGAILIFIIGLISFFNLIYMNYTWALFMLATFYMTTFLFHELGHRQVAIHYKLQTKFRLLTFGMLITSFSIIIGLYGLFTSSPGLPMIALPGAVVVLGLDKVSRKTGLCKAAGPFINLIYGSLLLIISFLIPKGLNPINTFIGYAAYFNFMLGTFNMLPFGILDGQNIWKWNKKIYIFLIMPLLILLIITLWSIFAPYDVNPYIQH